MEFHVLSTKSCRVEQTEVNFKLIKDSLNQLRDDLHEAEIDFHRKPLVAQPDGDEGDTENRMGSSGKFRDVYLHKLLSCKLSIP
jgi:hypothetical protein